MNSPMDPLVDGPGTAGGEVDLFLPTDWLDVLDGRVSGPEVESRARARFADLIATTLPTADSGTVAAAVEALMTWRVSMLALGAVGYGIVSTPVDHSGEPISIEAADAATPWVCWHVLVCAVAIPPAPAEADLGELLARALGRCIDADVAHVESFATDMGCGMGLLAQPAIDRAVGIFDPADVDPATGEPSGALTGPVPVASEHLPARYGLAAALTCAPGGGTGLLVTGVCLDPGQLLSLGSLIAVIAARSRIEAEEAVR